MKGLCIKYIKLNKAIPKIEQQMERKLKHEVETGNL